MRQIVQALMGEANCPPILDRLVDRFVVRVRDDFEDLIWDASCQAIPCAEPLYSSFVELAPSAQCAFCLSPIVFAALGDAKASMSTEAFEKLLTVTRHLAQGTEPDSGPLAGASAHVPNVFTIAQTIKVDIASPHCAGVDPSSPVFMRPLDPLTDEEGLLVKAKLDSAMAEIDATAPAFGRLIRNFTRRIFVRKIAGHPPASEQVDTELGAIRLRNVHSDLYSHDQLVDDLIHESTHNLLGTFEYLYFPFTPFGFGPEPTVRPVSPWSLRPIQALPFIHACFVYFALFHYAQIRLQSGLASQEETRRLLKRQNHYASGFLMPGRTSDVVASLAMTDPRVVQAIDWLEQVIRNHAEFSPMAAAAADRRRARSGMA